MRGSKPPHTLTHPVRPLALAQASAPTSLATQTDGGHAWAQELITPVHVMRALPATKRVQTVKCHDRQARRGAGS